MKNINPLHLRKSGATCYLHLCGKGTGVLLLNKSEAAHHLHTLHEEFLAENDTIENKHPDFHSLLTENLRNPLSDSAIKASKPRGNQNQYTQIDCVRVEGRAMYGKGSLESWFDTHYAPTLILAA